MTVTTVKVSTATRDRLRTFGGPTIEATINEALDALESAQFWQQAEAHATWRRGLPEDRRRAIDERERKLDEIVTRFR